MEQQIAMEKKLRDKPKIVAAVPGRLRPSRLVKWTKWHVQFFTLLQILN
jgi:hypothetical protein